MVLRASPPLTDDPLLRDPRRVYHKIQGGGAVINDSEPDARDGEEILWLALKGIREGADPRAVLEIMRKRFGRAEVIAAICRATGQEGFRKEVEARRVYEMGHIPANLRAESVDDQICQNCLEPFSIDGTHCPRCKHRA
ncbi:hypothetical protein CMI37_35415 [Candidatus Pacearchaeota archaeon]|nr:hypothetical protein [Candidatus Pacearchaeota archaeon]|tara:strand:- start:122 stop:538 length:417 start_codon:yes stop_codon:yes gene_type:complete